MQYRQDSFVSLKQIAPEFCDLRCKDILEAAQSDRGYIFAVRTARPGGGICTGYAILALHHVDGHCGVHDMVTGRGEDNDPLQGSWPIVAEGRIEWSETLDAARRLYEDGCPYCAHIDFTLRDTGVRLPHIASFNSYL